MSRNFSIKIVFSREEKQTAYFISKLYLSRKHAIPMSVSKKEKIYHAAKLLDISARKMEKLYSHFGSISNIVNAIKSNSVNINGVGFKTLKKIKTGLDSSIITS